MVAGRIGKLLPQRQPPDGGADRYRVKRPRAVAASGIRAVHATAVRRLRDHPNGRTLAVVRPVGDARGREITRVLNWQEELRRRMRQ